MMRLYRYIINNFLIGHSQTLTSEDFTVKIEWARGLTKRLNYYLKLSFKGMSVIVWIPRLPAI